MKISGFGLYLKTESGEKHYIENNKDFFSFSVSEQKEDGATIIKGNLTAYKKIEPIWLDIMVLAELEGLAFNANGFQSWSESPLMDKNKKMGKMSGLPGKLFRLNNFGDYNFNKKAIAAGSAYSHLYLDLFHDGETAIFFGDLKPYDSYTFFAVNYSNGLVTAGSDLDGLLLNEGESLEIFKRIWNLTRKS